MREHRNPRDTVTNTDPDDNFDPGTALEYLSADVERLEALANAASDALDELPIAATTGDDRRPVGRLYALVNLLAHETAVVLDKGHKSVALLGVYLRAKREEKQSPPAARRAVKR